MTSTSLILEGLIILFVRSQTSSLPITTQTPDTEPTKNTSVPNINNAGNFSSTNVGLFGNCIQSPEVYDYRCLGFEPGCLYESSYGYNTIECNQRSGDPNIQTLEDQKQLFWEQTDFGYVKKKIQRMFQPFYDRSDCMHSSGILMCNDDSTVCTGTNITLALNEEETRAKLYYRKCQNTTDCRKDIGHLQSWTEALESDKDPPTCDVYLNGTFMFYRIDSSVNTYHHFTNFINLFITKLMNEQLGLEPETLVLWRHRFVNPDQNEPPPYDAVWRLFGNKLFFSQGALIRSVNTAKYSVCLERVVLAHPPRVRRGIYFKMPMVFGCRTSGLFQAFSAFLLNSLNINIASPKRDRIRVTLINRGEKEWRRIENIDQLQAVLMAFRGIDLRVETFDRNRNFLKQMEIIANTDVLVAMHGAVLTQMLWLPPWAGVVEIYNCGDEACYYDLAQLKGVNYRTGHPAMSRPLQGVDYKKGPKFRNYWVDAEGFLELVLRSVRAVITNRQFKRNAK